MDIPFLEHWCAQLAQRVGATPWFLAATNHLLAHAYHNTTLFVRSLYLQLLCSSRSPAIFVDDPYFQQPPSVRDSLLPLLERTVRTLGGGFYPQESANEPTA